MNLTTEQRVNKIIRRSMGLKPDFVILSDTKLNDDLGIDSLDLVELCMDIEIEFNIEFTEQDDDQWGNAKTVQDVIDLTNKVNDNE